LARILVVDDEPLACYTISEMVEATGHEAIQANSAPDALLFLKSQEIDAIITDIVMPGMDGNKLIELVKNDFPELPIIAMTGGGRTMSHDYLDIAKKVGAEKVITKPFLFADINDVLQELDL
jgi:CheY-like chemotaxis protein